MNLLLMLLSVTISIDYCKCSPGDRSPYYRKCVEHCLIVNCSEDGRSFIGDYKQPFILYITQWSCFDECKYQCMWKTIEGFDEHNWPTPQFHGKWPFIRVWGLQEPASVAFSVLNGYAHLKMIQKFRNSVRHDSPLSWLWHSFCIVSLHAWFWSALFHARDYPLTEFLDYACAFSMVLMSFYVVLIRLLRNKISRFALSVITASFIAFFVRHVTYLSSRKINYGYNMQLNILIASLTALCWFCWCAYNLIRQPYAWKCGMFVSLTAVATLLEIIDRPPFFHVFDCHSLWHLATAPLVILLYSFAIDDCNYLRRQQIQGVDDKKEP